MSLARTLRIFQNDEDGGIMVFWAMVLVIFLGLVSLIFDMGRLATTQSEFQSFADSVSLAAAAELDGKSDAITRAQNAANSLITDAQTYGDGAQELSGSEDISLTFYMPTNTGEFHRSAALETTNPRLARFVSAQVASRRVTPGFGAAFSSLTGLPQVGNSISAHATAGFSLEACNVAPITVCLPSVDFDASTSIGETLELEASVNVGQLLPGQIAAVDTLTNTLDGLSICAGLLGGDLEACLLASRTPETACTGRGGIKISANLSGTDILDSVNTRFDEFRGIASGLAGNDAFSGAPNVLTGETNILGLCVPLGLAEAGDTSLPADDCFDDGSCGLQGDGHWQLGREAYVNAHYDGTDPHPTAATRFEFYQAEIAASASTPTTPSLGGLLGGFTPQMCAPQDNLDPNRRLMVVAGIDCLSSTVNATGSVPPVQQFFEVFALGPAADGKLKVEITACLGRDCGTGNLDTEVRDIVRLVE